MNRYQNKICLITASSTGIGLAIAQRFASEGATVIISSRSAPNVNSAVEKIKKLGFTAVGFPCHVGNKKDRENLINFISKNYGKLDVLVANAAVSTFFGDLFEIKEEQMDKMYEVNLKSTFFLVKESLGLLRKGTNPNICIVSSYAAFEPDLTIAFYSVTKTALIGLMKVMAKYLTNEDIRVNCLAPGLIKTKFSSGLWEGNEEGTKNYLGIKRLGEVQDVAGVAAFICSEDAVYVTGETIVVAGKVMSRL